MAAIPPALNETSPVKFFLVTLEISMLNRTHEKNALFERAYFGPKKCCALKFSNALENDQVLLAHLTPRTGAFFTIFF